MQKLGFFDSYLKQRAQSNDYEYELLARIQATESWNFAFGALLSCCLVGALNHLLAL